MTYKKEPIHLKGVQKIGVIMLGLLGNVLMRTPVLKALKEIYPDATLVTIVDTPMQAILKHNSYVDEQLLMQRKHKGAWKKNRAKIKGVLEVRAQKFDLIVDLYNGGSSPLLVALSGAKYRLGYTNKKHKFVYNIQVDYLPELSSVIHTYNKIALELIKPLSNKEFSPLAIFEIPQEAQDEIQEYIKEYKLNMNNIYTLNLGSGGEEKLLTQEKIFKLVEYIYEKYGAIPAIVSNPSQEYLQESLIRDYLQASKIPYVKLKPLSLPQVAAFIKVSRFIITPDTGLMHIAMSQESFIYALFTYTNPLCVESQGENFVAVYDRFDESEMFRSQKIKVSLLKERADTLFKSLDNAK